MKIKCFLFLLALVPLIVCVDFKSVQSKARKTVKSTISKKAIENANLAYDQKNLLETFAAAESEANRNYQTQYDQPTANNFFIDKPLFKPYNAKPYNGELYNAQPYNGKPYNTYGQQSVYQSNKYTKETIIQANVLFREGDRTPSWLPRHDYYKESDFPEGLDMLYNVGIKRMFNLGQELRERYMHLISKCKKTNVSKLKLF